MINYKAFIKRNPNKRFGKPCVRETRITVYDVLAWLAIGMTYVLDLQQNSKYLKSLPDYCSFVIK